MCSIAIIVESLNIAGTLPPFRMYAFVYVLIIKAGLVLSPVSIFETISNKSKSTTLTVDDPLSATSNLLKLILLQNTGLLNPVISFSRLKVFKSTIDNLSLNINPLPSIKLIFFGLIRMELLTELNI